MHGVAKKALLPHRTREEKRRLNGPIPQGLNPRQHVFESMEGKFNASSDFQVAGKIPEALKTIFGVKSNRQQNRPQKRTQPISVCNT